MLTTYIYISLNLILEPNKSMKWCKSINSYNEYNIKRLENILRIEKKNESLHRKNETFRNNIRIFQ